MAFYFINKESLLDELAALKGATILGVDVETAGRNPFKPQQNRVRLVQIASDQDTFVIDLDRVDPWSWLKPVFTDKAVVKVFHNAKFDVKQLMYHFDLVVENLFCTYLSAILLAMGARRIRFSLAEVAQRFLGEHMDKTEQTSDFGGTLTDEQIRYAGHDAEVLPRLYHAMQAQLKHNKLLKASKLECRTVVPVAAMELRGIHVDKAAMQKVYQSYTQKARALASELEDELQAPDALPGMNTLNLDAPEQVKDALNARGIAVEDTSDGTLRPLIPQYPFIAKFLEYRHVVKVQNSGLMPMMESILQETGRVHASYQQIASASGRFACSDPNIQQVPREREVRACFKPEPGYLYVIADYSQVELRVAAGLSSDPIMLNAYSSGQDLHRLTAALTMDKPIEEVSKEERQAAKAINFGLIYAMGARGLQLSAKSSYGVEMDINQATAFRERYFRNYQGIARWQKELEREVRARGFVRTRGGRIRAYKDDEMRVTEVLNIPVQGTAAEGLKSAMCIFWDKVREDGLDASIVAIIHDEIIVEVKREQAQWAQEILENAMIRGIQWLVPDVSFEVESAIATSWAGKG